MAPGPDTPDIRRRPTSTTAHVRDFGDLMSDFPPPGAPGPVPDPGTGPSSGAPGWPGAAPGPYPAPAGPGAPYGGPVPGPPPPWGAPPHQPGTVPLRPLTLGDIFGGALKTIRHNPRATVGMAAVVTFGFMLLPMLGTVLLGATGMGGLDPLAPSAGSGVVVADIGLFASTAIGGLFSLFASIVVTGLVVRTVEQGVLGRPITAGEAWRRSRGRLLPLLLLVVLVGVAMLLVVGLPIAAGVAIALTVDAVPGVVLAVLGGLLGMVAAVFLYTRYVLLAAPVLVLEERGVWASMARAGQLARNDFWRLFGIYLLASLAGAVVGQVIALPFAALGMVGTFALPAGWGFVAMMLSSHVATVLTGALVGPFTGGVLALQYLDQRFRKEGLDIELVNQTASPAAR